MIASPVPAVPHNLTPLPSFVFQARKIRRLSDENRRMFSRVQAMRTSVARAVAAVARPSSARPPSRAAPTTQTGGGARIAGGGGGNAGGGEPHRPGSARAMLAGAVGAMASARVRLRSSGGGNGPKCKIGPSESGTDGGERRNKDPSPPPACQN
jgi:hypothetical protein